MLPLGADLAAVLTDQTFDRACDYPFTRRRESKNETVELFSTR